MKLGPKDYNSNFRKPQPLVIRVPMEEFYHEALEKLQQDLDIATLNRTVEYIFVKAHREHTLLSYLEVHSKAPLVFAPPTGARRLTIRLNFPLVMVEIKQAAGKVNRPLPVIAYSVLRRAISEHMSAFENQDENIKRA